jgi:putative ABC transport system permease protein
VIATQGVGMALEITMTITPGYIIMSVAVSSIIGIVAGLYPAWKAARLDPIVALQQT